MSSSTDSSSSVGGEGGEKKEKNESVGTTFLTMRVWLVSANVTRGRRQRKLRWTTRQVQLVPHAKLTLVALLLGLNPDGEVLALDPLDLGSDGVVVDKISLVSHFVLVVVGLLQLVVGEECL